MATKIVPFPTLKRPKSVRDDRAMLENVILACSALVVESNDAFGRAAHVGDYKADTRIEFARMPFDLGNHPAWFPPASGLIGEIRVVTPHLVRRSSNRARQQIADPPLQDAVGGKPDRILYPRGFEVLVNFRIREACVRSKIDA